MLMAELVFPQRMDVDSYLFTTLRIVFPLVRYYRDRKGDKLAEQNTHIDEPSFLHVFLNALPLQR